MQDEPAAVVHRATFVVAAWSCNECPGSTKASVPGKAEPWPANQYNHAAYSVMTALNVPGEAFQLRSKMPRQRAWAGGNSLLDGPLTRCSFYTA